jgi:hypothetical protein
MDYSRQGNQIWASRSITGNIHLASGGPSGREMSKTHNPILDETKNQMEIVPYTKRDRFMVTVIFIIVLANFITLMFTIPWRSLF